MGEMAVFTAVATAVSAVAQIGAGAQSRQAAELERRQYEEEAQNARLQADQEEAVRRDDLRRSLATADAIRAGRGVDLNSPTGQAIRDDMITTAEEDIGTARYNALRQASRFDLAAAQATARGNAALLQGFGGAAGSVLTGARLLSSAGSGSGTPSPRGGG